MFNFICLMLVLACSSVNARIIKVAIASQNAQKVNAVKEVFNQKFNNVNDRLEFTIHKTDSKIQEQPIGRKIALTGAINRLNSILKDILENADYAIAIENFIEYSPNINCWNDTALILITERPTIRTTNAVSLSQPTQIPERFIDLAKKLSGDNASVDGQSVTVGQAIAQSFTDKDIDEHDWHKEFEFGGVSRQKLLKDAIYKALHAKEIYTLKQELKVYKDFPKPGINFIDFLPILENPNTFKLCIDLLADHYKDQNIDAVVGLESRGFILAAAMAQKLNTAFVPVRKPGKLPCEVHSVTYNKEYGTDTFTIAKDSLTNKRVLIVDDVIATGGSARAAIELVKLAGGTPVDFITILQVKELAHLTKLGIPLFNLID